MLASLKLYGRVVRIPEEIDQAINEVMQEWE
jgi:hypothetical protein